MCKRVFFVIAVLGFAVAYALSTTKPYVCPTFSMSPTILPGDHMLVKSVPRALKRGEIVWFRAPHDPKQQFLKRVIGLPGDRIRLVNKQVLLNGKPLDEPYAIHTTNYTDEYRDNFPATPNVDLPEAGSGMLARHVVNGEAVVPGNSYFVLGDNRDNSLDSRYFGFVPACSLTGKPIFIYWSFDKDTGKTRWSRTFRRL